MELGETPFVASREKDTEKKGMHMQRMTERNDELERRRRRYAGRGKEGKSRLLDEFCEHHGYERKYAIKLLQAGAPRPGGGPRPGPEPKYEPVREVVERIWRGAEQVCGKRLAPALALWLPHYARHYGALLPPQKKLLRSISAATLDRLLADAKAQASGGLSGTRPGTLLRHQVPIQGEVWDERRLGFLEADSVAHCGSSLAGSFIWSLTYTDLASTWTAGRAVWNKGARGVLEQTQDVEQTLPFAIVGFDFDNGGEWLNCADPLPASAAAPHSGHALAPVSQRRQRPRGAEELDVAATTAGLRTAGGRNPPPTDQRPLHRGVGAAAQFLSALDAAGGQMAGGQPVGAAA